MAQRTPAHLVGKLPAPFSNTAPECAEYPQVLAQGAEAVVYRTTFLAGLTPCVLKHRQPKTWRHPTLDRRLTRARVLAEGRVLLRLRREGIDVPALLALDADVGWLVTEWISGMTVRACLDRHAHLIARPSAALVGLMARIGRCIGRMHHAGVVHGDLTTSNLMLRVRLFDEGEGGQDRERGEQDTESEKQDTDDKTEKDNDEDNGGEIATETATENEPENEPETELTGSVVLIDFGLSSQTVADEDRAVDLYVLERAFTATHSSSDQLFAHAVSAYGHSYAGAPAVLRRLEEVRQRGRKRTMVG